MARGKKTGGRRPGSRNKTSPAVREIALAMVPDASKTLRALLKGATDQVKIKAIEIVYERAFGRPAQSVQHSGAIGTYDLSKLTDAQLDSLETILGPLADDPSDQGGEGQTAVRG